MVFILSTVDSPFKPVATKCKEGEKA